MNIKIFSVRFYYLPLMGIAVGLAGNPAAEVMHYSGNISNLGWLVVQKVFLKNAPEKGIN